MRIYIIIYIVWSITCGKTHFPISLYILIITYGYIKEYQGIYNLIHKVAKHIVWFRLITHPLYYIFPYVVLRMNIQLSPFWWPGGPWPSKRRIPQKEILEVEIQVVLRHIPQTAAVARGCNNVAANSGTDSWKIKGNPLQQYVAMWLSKSILFGLMVVRPCLLVTFTEVPLDFHNEGSTKHQAFLLDTQGWGFT